MTEEIWRMSSLYTRS